MPSYSKSVFPTIDLVTSKQKEFQFQMLEFLGKVGNPDHVSCSKWPSNLHTMRRKEKRIEQPRKRKSAKKWVKIRLRLASTVVTSLKKNLLQKIYGGFSVLTFTIGVLLPISWSKKISAGSNFSKLENSRKFASRISFPT